MSRENSSDFEQIFLQQLPLMDVRAPVEFAQGSFPGAKNLPLMEDDEREAVGKRYKDAGQAEAIALGESFYTEAVKQARQGLWLRFAEQNPNGYLFCFRGGLRSKLVKQLLQEAGCDYPLIEGGYKAMRRFLIDKTVEFANTKSFIIVGGYTGAGKTLLLEKLDRSADLEGLAKHRGSAFGHYVDPQPPQIDFENTLACDLLRLFQASDHPVFLEDEGRNIGSRSVPKALWERMSVSPLVMLEADFDTRVEISLKNYVVDMLADFHAHFDGDAEQRFADHLLTCVDKIAKRLGGERHKKARGLLTEGLQTLQSRQSTDDFRPFIGLLLAQYYDPMYEYQIGKKLDRVVYRGSAEEIRSWAQDEALNLWP